MRGERKSSSQRRRLKTKKEEEKTENFLTLGLSSDHFIGSVIEREYHELIKEVTRVTHQSLCGPLITCGPLTP